jgi:hypothetical protein
MTPQYLELIFLTAGILIGIGMTFLVLVLAAYVFMEKDA